MNTSPVLRLKGISKRFPGVVALDGVDLEVYPAEVVALIGENGAGKSTLMKILGGVTGRDAGTIQVEGQETEIRSPREASRLGIEFIHQELSVLDNLDVGANIFLRREPTSGGFLKLMDRKRIYAESDALLQKLGLNLSSRTQCQQTLHRATTDGRNCAQHQCGSSHSDHGRTDFEPHVDRDSTAARDR